MSRSLWSETRSVELRPGVHVVLRHIGGPEDALLWDRIQARWSRTTAKMEAGARRELLSEFGDAEAAMDAVLPSAEQWQSIREALEAKGLTSRPRDFGAAVNQWMHQSEAWIDAYSARVKELITLGLVDGEKEYARLFEVGGPDLLSAAANRVTEFHGLEKSQGEG